MRIGAEHFWEIKKMDIKDIPMWIVSGGIGHAVQQGLDPSYTACGSVIFGGGEQTEMPKRICKKCRKRIKDATLTKKD